MRSSPPQQLRGEVREQAEREAQLILREAQAEGERIIESAKSDVRRMEEELDNLDRSRRTYLAQMRTLIARQLSEVEASDSQVVASTLRGAGSNSSGSKPRMTAVRPVPAAAGGDDTGKRFRLLPTDRSPDELEKEMLSRWKEEGLFQKTLAQAAGSRSSFSSRVRPTANGKPGIHHVFSRTVKDHFLPLPRNERQSRRAQSGLGYARPAR